MIPFPFLHAPLDAAYCNLVLSHDTSVDLMVGHRWISFRFLVENDFSISCFNLALMSGIDTKGWPLVQCNLICLSDSVSSQPCCPFSNLVTENQAGLPMGVLICSLLYGAALFVEWTPPSQYHIYVYMCIYTHNREPLCVTQRAMGCPLSVR